MSEPEKTFWEEVKDDLKKGAEEIQADAQALKDEYVKAAKKVDKGAANLAIKAEEIWEKGKLNDRLYGSAGGAKIGALFGLRAGPKGAAVGAAVGSVVGFVYGDEAIQKFRKWRDGHKPDEKQDNESDSKPPPPQV